MSNFQTFISQFLTTASGRRASGMLSKQGLSPEVVMRHVYDEVIEVLPAMVADVQYSTRVVCDPAWWTRLSNGARRAAGMCLRYLVETGVLPLLLVPPKGTGTLKYVLNPCADLGAASR